MYKYRKNVNLKLLMFKIHNVVSINAETNYYSYALKTGTA